MKNLIKRLQDRLESRKVEGEQGSLLLDVLIGMAIFALIALIAVSAVNGYRQRAYQTGTQSDVTGLGLEIEANYTDTESYVGMDVPGFDVAWRTTDGSYAAISNQNGTGLLTFDQKVTAGDTVACYMPYAGTVGSAPYFKIAVQHKSGANVDAWTLYDSSAGGVVETARGSAAQTAPVC